MLKEKYPTILYVAEFCMWQSYPSEMIKMFSSKQHVAKLSLKNEESKTFSDKTQGGSLLADLSDKKCERESLRLKRKETRI